ncbi:MAG: HD domain-containing protein [Coriobacteriia bacterium]|nr:HD domain-containing protein [Coriobacteriia bacterium]
MTQHAAADTRATSERLAFLFEHMLDGVAYFEMVTDDQGLVDWVYLDVNPAFYRLTGLRDVIGKRASVIIPGLRESNPELFEMYARIARTGAPEEIDLLVGPLDTWLHIHANRPTPDHVLAIYEDISERKESEQTLSRTTRRLKSANAKLDRAARGLRLLSLTDKVLVRAADEDSLLQDVCELIVATGYPMAWVGLAASDAKKSVRVAAKAGDHGFIESLGDVSWDVGQISKTPIVTCIREERTVDIRNLKTWKTRAEWKRAALARGFHASLDLPICVDGVVVGALEMWGREVNTFGDDERQLFEELADSIGFGISSQRAHRTTKRASQSLGLASMRLEQMVMDVTEAIGRVVEVRDPYTQGHQERVARLAKMIAGEMGLSGDDMVAIEVTGLVHDVGKMKVPVEILAKPDRLDETQYAIVKQHSQAGYEILKDIAFPWPVADIVLQHHERMDGTGYPNGLVGDQIGILARILGVADVVEALSSHRPHRPAIGLDAAIEEIKRGNGAFDPAVVEACVRLYEQGRIEL